jgi:hypothetical protein
VGEQDTAGTLFTEGRPHAWGAALLLFPGVFKAPESPGRSRTCRPDDGDSSLGNRVPLPRGLDSGVPAVRQVRAREACASMRRTPLARLVAGK